ncbi:MAG: YwhD family protein [Bacillaceae bacterium]|nr:YwhD family protein [Bacillaceae bacterium]
MDLLNNNKGKKGGGFNIVSTKKDHSSFGSGVIDLNNVAPVIIEGDEAYIDMGAMHARSKVERGIKFTTNKDEVPDGKRVWIVWVATDHNEKGPYYAGVTACEMLIDREARKGYKILAEHVNNMDYAMKRRIILDGLNETEKKALATFLQEHKPHMWENSSDELKEALKVG